MSTEPPNNLDFAIHIDQDCITPSMEEPTIVEQPDLSSGEHTLDQPEAESVPAPIDAYAYETNIPETTQLDGQEETDPNTPQETTDEDLRAEPSGEPEFDSHESILDDPDDESGMDSTYEQSEELQQDLPAASANSEQEGVHDSSELEDTMTHANTHDEGTSSRRESTTSLERRHSVRTEALIQAAARAVVSLRRDSEGEAEGQLDHGHADDSILSSTTHEAEDPDETVQPDNEQVVPSRPESSASQSLTSTTEPLSEGEAASSHHDTEDDVFSDHSPRSSINSAEKDYDEDTIEQMTEKGDLTPDVRSRVTSGVSTSGASGISDLSRLSRYEKEEFTPTARIKRPAFRGPSSVRAMQMSSPTPSIYPSPIRSTKRQEVLPTISRLGSPSASGQYSPRGRSMPSRFKRQEAPLVLLHVTLLPLRWVYGDVVNHFESKKLAPISFSGEGLKSLRSAWRQLQDRLGDTVLERGILLPHPQNDYEILEERLLEALELPLRRRARILECGHYLGPSNEMTPSDDTENDSEDISDSEGSEAGLKREKRHWCRTCKGDIRYEELGSERIFRIKVYASNGLMSAGAWEACWKEMERVDIEVEPIIDSRLQSELAKLAAAFEQDQRQQLEAEHNQQTKEEQRIQFEEEQRLQLEAERLQQLEEERYQLEAQRKQFEEERRQALEEARKELEEHRQKFEEEQRQRLEEERHRQFEEERQQLDAQRQQFEEQRQELEQQRKTIEEEQRQHLEEARRKELDEEHLFLEEQRQQLEEARQKFEEERRQRLEEEEELRRLQREEDERRQRLEEEEEMRRLQREEDELKKQVAALRTSSRNSYVEEDLASPPAETTMSTDLDVGRRDSDRLREIYGNHSRASSDGIINSSSPSIHIHVDSGRQREEQNSRQLAIIPTPQGSGMHAGQAPPETRHPDPYSPPYSPSQPSPPSPPSEQAYQRRDGRRRSLETASLPELLGETIRVLVQDPRNVAIAVLVVLIAMLAGQFTRREERGVEIYKPQQNNHPHHQLDAREPMGQVVMNTPPAVHYTENAWSTPSQIAETVYRTVTESSTTSSPPVAEVIYKTVTESSSKEPSSSQEVETVYKTVTQSPLQETPSRVVETVYHTVTESLVDPPAQSAIEERQEIAAPEVASELTPTSADPKFDLIPLSFAPLDVEERILNSSSSPHTIGSDAFTPSPSLETEAEPEHVSDEELFKTIASEAEIDVHIENTHETIAVEEDYIDTEAEDLDAWQPNSTVYSAEGEETNLVLAPFEEDIETEIELDINAASSEGTTTQSKPAPTTMTLEDEYDIINTSTTNPSTTFTTPGPQTSPLSTETITSSLKEKRTVRVCQTITETVYVTTTRTRAAAEMQVTQKNTASEHEDAFLDGIGDGNMDMTGMEEQQDEDDVYRETLIETVRVTSTIEVDEPQMTCTAFGHQTTAAETWESSEESQ